MPSRKSRPATLTSIAEAVGLAPSTVGFILRGQARAMHISHETEQHVCEVARRMGYVPNLLARNLRRQRTGVIGLLVPDLALNWSDLIYQGMFSVLDPAGYTPFLLSHRWDPKLQAAELEKLVQHQVEAIVCAPIAECHDLYRRYAAMRIPFLLMGDTLEDLPEVGYVGWDSEHAAALAVQHLVDCGCTRLAFIGPDHPTMMTRRRMAAFERVLKENRLPVNRDWISVMTNQVWTLGLTDQWVTRVFAAGDTWPDGIFALNDAVALLALESLGRAGVRVPDDVAVVGIGNLPMTGLPGISLTTAVEPIFELGREAAAAALALINGEMEAPVHTWIPRTELIVRGSTARTGADA